MCLIQFSPHCRTSSRRKTKPKSQNRTLAVCASERWDSSLCFQPLPVSTFVLVAVGFTVVRHSGNARATTAEKGETILAVAFSVTFIGCFFLGPIAGP